MWRIQAHCSEILTLSHLVDLLGECFDHGRGRQERSPICVVDAWSTLGHSLACVSIGPICRALKNPATLALNLFLLYARLLQPS